MPDTKSATIHELGRDSKLFADAYAVLKRNDIGRSTKPAPQLYPHQWSWDSAFIAIGLSHVDPDRALLELETLFDAQWADGRVPHIVFNPEFTDYFPGPDRWECAEISPVACKKPATSGLIQPPVHALAAWKIAQVDQANGKHLQKRLRILYAKLMRWHEYLADKRDPEKMGLISIYHPWESGTDNSPRWDFALKNVVIGEVPPYTRRDTKHVADPSERPTKEEYDRFLWLVECLKKAKYDDASIYKEHPFIIKDTLMSAIFASANRSLSRLSALLEMPQSDRERTQEWERRTRAGLENYSWNEKARLALDLDVRKKCVQIEVSTCAGLAPILVHDFAHSLSTVCERIMGADFAGHDRFKFAVVPSTTPGTPGYHPRAYWRGPSWPVIDWLYARALEEQGFPHQAQSLRAANLALLNRPEARFGEYFATADGAQLGSPDQSWTAAVVMDWLASPPLL